MRLLRGLGERSIIFVNALTALALQLLLKGDDREAASLLTESLALSLQRGAGWQAADALEILAGVAFRRGLLERAAELFGAAAAQRETHARSRHQAYEGLYRASVAALRRALSDDRFEPAWAAGRALAPDEAAARALELAAGPRGPGTVPATPVAQQTALPDALSARELDVLRLLAAGKSNPEIAAALVIGLNTVYRHVTHIFNKIGVTTRVEAATYAQRHGLAPPAIEARL